MISVKEVELIHKTLIDKFGGSPGIRDISILYAALARPFQTFSNTELHPTLAHKAAALIESILINHPFIDGNKRTGYIVMRMFLLKNGLDIEASQEEKHNFVISIASGKIKFNDILDWLLKHLK